VLWCFFSISEPICVSQRDTHTDSLPTTTLIQIAICIAFDGTQFTNLEAFLSMCKPCWSLLAHCPLLIANRCQLLAQWSPYPTRSAHSPK
jgi:hypothetical protein